MKNKNSFSVNLLLFLREKNITQKKLAQMLNTKESVISHWLTGKVQPSSKSILKLSEIFDVPPGYFLEIGKQNLNLQNDNIQNDNSINTGKNGKENTDLKIQLLEEKNKRFETEIYYLKKEIENIKETLSNSK